MIPDSRQTIHIGINYVLAPTPVIDRERYLSFQQVLASRGVDVSKTSFTESEIIVARESPTQLQIKVAPIPSSPVGQLLILAPGQWSGLDAVIKEFEAIVAAFQQTWLMDHRQIISVDAAIRDLYETSFKHAFKELWEARLGQSEDALSGLGGPVLGGGLRFVVPQLTEIQSPCQAEVKIESFLQDSSKIFVETQFAWPSPAPIGTAFEPGAKLRQVNEYIETKLIAFITGESK